MTPNKATRELQTGDKMMIGAEELKLQEDLQKILQNEAAGVLEKLASLLIGRLVKVTVSVARAGFQHGGDAGPAGRQGRRFRIEAKRYADNTPLSDRELLGEIDHALRRDPALDGWILVSTREVSEQIEESLHGHGLKNGVPVLVIDWKSGGISSLAALCSSAPDIVESVVSNVAGRLADRLKSAADNSLKLLTRELQAWCMGYETLRAASHHYLHEIWIHPRKAAARLGQNAAIGSVAKRLPRRSAYDLLDDWWMAVPANYSPAVAVGYEGVGKTWAVLDWLYGHLDDMPLAIIVPASAMASLHTASLSAVKSLLADCLHAITGVRDRNHWQKRLERILGTPMEEGPVLTIFFDGMNQQSSLPWAGILQVFQDDPLVGRVRVIVSTRKHHFEDKLASLRSLIDRPVPVVVDIYDDLPGGELDEMLAFEGLTREDLPPDLVEPARNPRLFKLVVRFREGLVGVNRLTPHRLLWEYGKHTLDGQAGMGFSEDDWRAWLQQIAKDQFEGVKGYSTKDLSELSSREDLRENEVYARLSEILDSRFVVRGGPGEFIPTPVIISHALGMALLSHLERLPEGSTGSAAATLDQWLDPISGLDQRAEILRASVSILVEKGARDKPGLCGVMLTAWLQTQNLPDGHRNEVCRLARDLVSALLIVIEESSSHAQTSARACAAQALGNISRDDLRALEEMASGFVSWLSLIPRDLLEGPHVSKEAKANRSARWQRKIGEDRPGPRVILGRNVILEDRASAPHLELIPQILEGFPVAGAVDVLEAAALQLALRGTCDAWGGLKWLCLLNESDPREAAEAIRRRAEKLADRTLETGIDDRLGRQVASHLLRLSGEDVDEELADRFDPAMERWFSYEKDYLEDPSKSIFALERRHADDVLVDTRLNLWARINRTQELWLDPAFSAPAEFSNELREHAESFPVDLLSSDRNRTREDIEFEEMEPVIARCCPDLLATLHRRKIQTFAIRPADARYWSAVHADEQSLLIGEECRGHLRELREGGKEPNSDYEFHARASLLILELLDKSGVEQLRAIIEADLKYILVDWTSVIRGINADEGAELIRHYRNGNIKQQSDLILLLCAIRFPVAGEAWDWVLAFAFDPVYRFRHVACELLLIADAARFGNHLRQIGWSWTPGDDSHVDHYCSLGLIAGTLTTPFEQIADKVVPWLLPYALSQRPVDVTDCILAAEVFGAVLCADEMIIPDLGARAQVKPENRLDNPFAISIEIPQTDETDSAWFRSLDPETQIETRNRVVDTAVSRINEARQAGACYYLTSFIPADLKTLDRRAPGQLNLWLEGMERSSGTFRKRVRLAEGAYVALCEALLETDPPRGAVLWKSLRKLLLTRFIGTADVDELIHMAFRVPSSPASDAILRNLIDIREANTDRKLKDLALAAKINGREEWMRSVIENDHGSGVPWRMKRAVVMDGFLNESTLPNEDAWPEGGFLPAKRQLIQRAAKTQWRDSCARHWWRCYIDATEAEHAYAAWVLFFRSVDRSAACWMARPEMKLGIDSPLAQEKIRHLNLNKQALRRVKENRDERWGDQFLGRKICKSFGPWSEQHR